MSLYLERYAWPIPLFDNYLPNPDLEMAVVIPCFNEPNIEKALFSLSECNPPCKFLVIVVVNESEGEQPEVQQQNLDTVKTLSRLSLNYELKYAHIKLPPKKAGVGLARKIGMDEAVRLFELLENDGIIACFDADCTCEPNYLHAIHEYYQSHEKECGVVFYEHDLTVHTETITDYEIHLRYYIDALRWAGIPHAFQTLGSCITVKSKRYQKEGGMNTRKAGEDFYFLHKVIPNGKFGEIDNTTIYPSARISDRVPFGTGHAVAKNLETKFTTYNPLIFEKIKMLADQLDSIFNGTGYQFDEAMKSHLEEIKLSENIDRIRTESSNQLDFKKRFFRWFDGFKILKLVHFLRDTQYPSVPISYLFDRVSILINDEELKTKEEMLQKLRSFDRSPTF